MLYFGSYLLMYFIFSHLDSNDTPVKCTNLDSGDIIFELSNNFNI